MRAVALPSGGKLDVDRNPLVAVVNYFDQPKAHCDELQQAIEDHLQAERRYLDIAVLNDWRMFVIWGARGGDCRELPVIELRDEAHTTDAIMRRLDGALAYLN